MLESDEDLEERWDYRGESTATDAPWEDVDVRTAERYGSDE